MNDTKLIPRIVKEKYFELIKLLNKVYPKSVDEWGKFTDCNSRKAWITFGYFLNSKEPSVTISFWCSELKEFGNSQTGSQHCNNLKEAFDYLEKVERLLLERLEKKQKINSLFDDEND